MSYTNLALSIIPPLLRGASVIFACGIVTLVLQGLLLRQVGSCRQITNELLSRPCFPKLHLSWYEFEALPQNLGNVMLALSETWWLVALTSECILNWRATIQDNLSVLYPIAKFFVFAWMILWLPLLLPRMRIQMGECEQSLHVRTFMRIHPLMTYIATLLFIPVSSVLMMPVLHSAGSLNMTVIPHLLFLIVFLILVPASGNNDMFPFAHPPFIRESDVRLKRTFVFVQHVLLLMHLGVASVFHLNPVKSMVGRAVASLLLFIAHAICAPCAYQNINQLRGALYLYVFSAHIVNLLSGGVMSVQYVFAMISALFAVTVVAQLCPLVFPFPNRTMALDPKHLETLREHEQNLLTVRKAIEHCDRQRFTHAGREIQPILQDLQCQYTSALARYRAFKHRYLEPFYLGVVERPTKMPSPRPVSAVLSSPFTKDDLESWTRFGEQRLGSGMTGSVWLGYIPHNGSPRLVAMKEVLPGEKSEKQLMIVENEIFFLQRLVHPNIVRYYGCTRLSQGGVRVFMEYAPKGDLLTYLRSHLMKTSQRHFPVKRIAKDVLEGLAYLHSKGVIHRDVKCRNILLDENDRSRLADFGCSKMWMPEDNTEAIGTPSFMAPDMLGSSVYDTKVDIWSFGCTIVQILNGGLSPWKEDFPTVFSAISHIAKEGSVPSNIPETVSVACKDFLSKCFDRVPAKRWTATELLQHPWILEKDVEELLHVTGVGNGKHNGNPDVGTPISQRQQLPNRNGTEFELGATMSFVTDGDDARSEVSPDQTTESDATQHK